MNPGLNTPKFLSAHQQKSLRDGVEFRIIAFILLHIPLTFVLDLSNWLGTIHAVVVLLYGLLAASRRDHFYVIAILGYITGAEVLWRMTGTRLFWEYGKYASAGLALFAVMMANRYPLSRATRAKSGHVNPAIFFYLLFLLPSLVYTFSEVALTQIRNEISFNLSGPLAVTFLALYFWRRTISKKELVYFLIALLAPIMGIFTRAAWRTITASSLEFTLNANFVTSGGYGPNQVSNLLGLGALACMILLVLLWRQVTLRLFFLVIGVLLLFQAILTFSRGGVYSAVIAAIIFVFHLLTLTQARNRFAFLAITGFLLVWFAGIPFLDKVTSTVWQARFASLDSTGRLELARADWEIFLEHPLAGIGVGLSRQFREIVTDRSAASHTEFSRTLAEHGLLGVFSLVILMSLLIVNYVRAKPGAGRAITATFATWSLTIMVHSGMRFVAISLALALAMAAWEVSLEDAAWEE